MKGTPNELQWSDYTAGCRSCGHGGRSIKERLTRSSSLRALAVAYTCVISLLVLPIACQTDKTEVPLAIGRIANVTCQADPTQSYALYLPSGYDPAKTWPMIYLFDPAGRGSRPVELYKDVAEKYGFVLAGSNNSRNFSPNQSKNVAAIWQDTHLRLGLDEHRTYTSGFSGGARVAGAMALGCSPCHIAGVIAHGAGYPSDPSEAKNKVLYFFAVGDQDLNWPEVVTIRREREAGALPYRVRVFSGTHQWAPPAIMEDAVQWLVLKAIQAGNAPPDATFVDQLFRRRQAEAEDADKKNDAIAQLSAYRSLVSDFGGLKDVSEPEKKLALLKKSGSLKAALRNEQDQIAEQSALESGIAPKMRDYVNGSAPDLSKLRNDILQAMAGLRDRAAHSRNDGTRLVSRRALDDLFVAWMETGQQELESGHFEKAEACFQIMSQVKDDPWPVLLLADTHAAEGNRKLAIKDLHEAVKRGLNDPETIESDSKLQGLKTDAEFQKLLEQLKHK